MEMVKNILDGILLDNLIGLFLWYFFLFMIFGILIFFVLVVLCGFLVNKVEDIVKVILLVIYLFLGGYMFGLILGVLDLNNIVIWIILYILFLFFYIMLVCLVNEIVGMGGVLIFLLVFVVVIFLLMILFVNMYKLNVFVYSEGGLWSLLK